MRSLRVESECGRFFDILGTSQPLINSIRSSVVKMPVSIIAGEKDRLIDIDEQSARLHANIAQSKFHRIPGTGHMIHQTATSLVMSAIDEIAIG